jgi:hypothetical protein
MKLVHSAAARDAQFSGVLSVLVLILALLGLSTVAIAQDRQMGSGTVGGYRLNEFGPAGGKCMDACGPKCPPTCQVQEFSRCNADRPNLIESGTRYTCGAHASCAEHDSCLETCKVVAGDDWQEVDFFVGECEIKCHLTAAGQADEIVGGPQRQRPGFIVPANNSILGTTTGLLGQAAGQAAVRYGPTAKAIGGWISGNGPQDTTGTWEYTKDCPDCTPVETSCSYCEKCTTSVMPDGNTKASCEPNPEACPPCESCAEVHLSTHDRLRFDFQAAGEFVLFEDASGDHVAQIRTEPRTPAPVTYTTAVAVRVSGDVIAIHVLPDLRIVLNGKSIEMDPVSQLDLPGGGTLTRENKIITARWPDGTKVQSRFVEKNYMNVGVYLAPSLAGRTRGLAGDFDGDPDNDMKTRDGEQLPRRVGRDVLYGRFGNSWRIRQDESLFWYAPGESTATYTLADFPIKDIQLADLDPADIERAEQACRAQGIEHPRLFSDCVFDVAVTGDTSLTTGHWFTSLPAATLPATYIDTDGQRALALTAPTSVTAGAPFDVLSTGRREVGDFIAIARPDSDASAYLGYELVKDGESTQLMSPDEPGLYSIRYQQGERIIASRALEVREIAVSLTFPGRAEAGARIEVGWTGPAGSLDFIAVASSEAEPKDNYQARYVRNTNPVPLDLPETPGTYQLRYVQGRSLRVLASQPIEISAVDATLDAVAQMQAGGQIDVSWAGPGNRLDYIAVAAPGAPGDKYYHYRYVPTGNPVQLNLPEEPGRYEIRYVQGRSRTILATRTIDVLPVTATLDAPTQMQSGAQIEVSWTGPGNRLDYIAVAAPSGPADKYHSYRYAPAGNPALLTLPEEPGTYQIRYVQGRSKGILATRSIEVLPVTATLDSPAKIQSGGQIEVSWTGPGNRLDYIAVAVPTAPADKYHHYRYVPTGNPVQLNVPDESGVYEIRYVQGQSKGILARRNIEVEAVTASLDAPAEVAAGATIPVSWTGPGNRQDFIAIIKPSAPPSTELGYRNTNAGNPLNLKAPAEPGDYELCYVQSQSKNVLARRAIRVVK